MSLRLLRPAWVSTSARSPPLLLLASSPSLLLAPSSWPRPSPRLFRRSPSSCLRLSSRSCRPSVVAPSALSSPAVSAHLALVAGLVVAVVVVGGLTRLTQSGLSITEWNLVTGIVPPLHHRAWQSEFEKYMSTPEFALLNHAIQLDQFKSIYYWEWAHRLLGRVVGFAFLAPIPFLLKSAAIRGPVVAWSLVGIGGLIGAQGALGWYMVRSGLDPVELDARDGVPRVSQYRLAAHLLMAFAVYSACFRLAGSVQRDWSLAVEARPLDSPARISPSDSVRLLHSKIPARARVFITTLTGLILVTAGSGAFVAGLDAGLIYNTFPKMGHGWIPPSSELFSKVYSSPDSSSQSSWGWLRNLFENPTTVQFNHRLLASSTFVSTLGWFLYAHRHRRSLPLSTLRWTRRMMAMASIQVGLGISTLVYLVPTGLAAAHQAGSILLLSLSLACGLSLRRPSSTAMKEFARLSQSVRPNLACSLPKRAS